MQLAGSPCALTRRQLKEEFLETRPWPWVGNVPKGATERRRRGDRRVSDRNRGRRLAGDYRHALFTLGSAQGQWLWGA